MALAIRTGLAAWAMAEFMSTPSQPNSIALVASEAQPIPASNIVETLSAAQTLVNDGFDIMVYTSDDPIVAKELEKGQGLKKSTIGQKLAQDYIPRSNKKKSWQWSN
jgi:hypothetical protein